MWFHHITDPEDTSQLALNTKSVLAMRLIGKGEVSLHIICAMMDLPQGIVSSSYTRQVKKLLIDLFPLLSCVTSLPEKKKFVCPTTKIVKPFLTAQPIFGVVMTNQSSSGRFRVEPVVVVIISWDTGQVLDAHLMSKHCNRCTRTKCLFSENSEEFTEWYESHKPECTLNHSGSSCSMEVEGAKVLWGQSIEHFAV